MRQIFRGRSIQADRREATETSDGDHGSVELLDGEACEILADVVVALVAEYAQRCCLTQPKAPHVIRPPMNPREVACLTDVRGELVDFAVDRNSVRIARYNGLATPRLLVRRHNDYRSSRLVELEAVRRKQPLRIVAHAPAIDA